MVCDKGKGVTFLKRNSCDKGDILTLRAQDARGTCDRVALVEHDVCHPGDSDNAPTIFDTGDNVTLLASDVCHTDEKVSMPAHDSCNTGDKI